MPERARLRDGPYAEPEFGPLLAQAAILVVDDEAGMRNFLVKTLGPRCKAIAAAGDVREASGMLDADHYDVVILDNIMPGRNGVEWLAEQRQIGLFADTILMTAYADLETAIQALRAGAVDFVLKPFRSNQILNAVARCLDRRRLQRENFLLRHELAADDPSARRGGRLLGQSPAIRRIRDTLARVAALPTSVLITGESGTGKEVAARALHAGSERADKPFVPINCAAIPAEMVESELFGHAKGAFTGAGERRDGLFQHGNGGTLFLDEIGELPVPMQSKLLRVIEDKRIRPVGAERELPLDVRFVFATNAELETEVEAGRFRADLYYRVNVVRIEMPPLRGRREDVEELTRAFMQHISRELGMAPLPVTPEIAEGLAGYDWPGNVRELRNLVERSLILGAFPAEFRGGRPAAIAPGGDDDMTLEAVERRHILRVLAESGGNRAEAARRLGVSRKTIDRKCAEWGT